MELAERVFSTRRGTILIAVGAAVLAGIVLLVYVRGYRQNVSASSAATSVLVARSLIEKGTPGAVVGTEHLYQIASVPKTALLAGAYVDPSALRTGVATSDIFPGQQLTAGDFAQPASTLDTEISGTQRALTLPIDPTRTIGGQLASGDRIDIYFSTSAGVRQILENIPVLIGANGSTVTVRVDAKQAALLALAVDTGKVWFTLRPTVGAPSQPLVSVTPQTLAGGK
ncbi:MAG TPA: hypothetical protein VEH55_11710 [Gaiellaceae bacterium]|nr:hypothetical protein [Gaiellaceae bacterium]